MADPHDMSRRPRSARACRPPTTPSSRARRWSRHPSGSQPPYGKTTQPGRTPRKTRDPTASRATVPTPPNPNDAIFASRRGTWLSPNNVRRQWRQARAETDLEWVTPHTFRKTVATLIDKEADTKSAAAQLGHASEEVTDTYYIAKPVLAPDVSEILEQLGADRGDDDRAQGHRRSKRAA